MAYSQPGSSEDVSRLDLLCDVRGAEPLNSYTQIVIEIHVHETIRYLEHLECDL